MSAPTIHRRELKNCRLYFIPQGELVSAVTVANATWPTNIPVTNYTDFEIKEIEDGKLERAISSEMFKIPSALGGYIDDPEEMIGARVWKFSTHRTNNYIKQLENGLAAAPVVSVAQAPGARNDNFIEGVAQIEMQNKNGTMIERYQIWARMRVSTSGDAGPATAKVELSIEMRYSSLNTYITYAG